MIKISRATYYRWKKAGILPAEGDYEVMGLRQKKSQSQSRSQSRETFSSLDSQYDALFEVFKRLFVAASSRGIPKKIVLECERFL